MRTNTEEPIKNLIKTIRANAISLLNAIKDGDESKISSLISQLRRLEKNIYRRVRRDKDLSHDQKHQINLMLAQLQAIYHKDKPELKKNHLNSLNILAGEEEVISEKLEKLFDDKDYHNLPVYVELCKLIGVSNKTNFKQLEQKLLQMDQEDMGNWETTYLLGPEKTSLYPIKKFVLENYSRLEKIPNLLLNMVAGFNLWYQHTAEMLITRRKFNEARKILKEAFELLPPLESVEFNPGTHMLDAFLKGDLARFEGVVKYAWKVNYGQGWDGKNTYDFTFIYRMHAELKGMPLAEIDKHVTDGSVKFKHSQDVDIYLRKKGFPI